MFLVDGCPIAFGTPGCPDDFHLITCPTEDSLVDAHGNPIGGFPTARPEDNWPEIAPRTLALSGFSWDEDATSVLQADLKVSAPNIVLFDKPMTIDGVVRPRGVTYLGTRRASQGTTVIPNTRLTNTLLSSGATFDIDAPSAFPGFASSTVWIEGEAIRCSTLVGSTLTVRSAPDGRGAYNSIVAHHTVDVEASYHPTVWWGFPGFDDRRVSLWQIDPIGSGAYVATRMWTGYSNDIERSGTAYQVNCTNAIVTERARPVGASIVATRLRGYNVRNSWIALSWSGGPPHGLSTAESHFVPNPPGGRVVNTPREFLDRMASVMRREQLDPVAGTWPGSITLTEGTNGVVFYASVTSVTEMRGTLSIDGVESSATSTQTTDPHTVTVTGAPLPPVIIAVTGGEAGETPITSIAGLGPPTSWIATSVLDGDLRTALTPVMRGQIDDSHWAVIEPRSVVEHAAGVADQNPGPFLIGPTRIETTVNDRNPRNNTLKTHVPVRLTPQILVTSPHWLLAMRRGFVEDTTFANSGADPRDWDWIAQGAVLRATQGPYASIQFYLDGNATIDTTFRERMKATACSIGVRRGRLAPFAFRPPLATDPVVATFTKRQFVGKPPFWRRLKNALCNTVECDIGTASKLVVRDQQSFRRYGLGAPLTIKFPLDEIRGSTDLDPFVLLDEVLTRLFGTFGTPVSLVTFSLGASHANDCFIGDYVKMSDWISPNGDGAVGLNATVGQVVQRSPQNIGGPGGDSFVTFTLLLYGRDAISGFAPGVRAASLTTTTLARDTIVAAINYLNQTRTPISGATDYAGSNELDYLYYNGFVNDGGVSHVHAGDHGRLFERNSTTPHAPESVKVLVSTPSSTPGSSKIQFDASVDAAWAAIAAAGNLDYVPDVYSVSGTAQRKFCYVATQTPPYPIGGTTDPPKVFA
jgi:hypothetical protein